MNNKLKEVFDQVQAEEKLKASTKRFVYQKTNGYTRSKAAISYRFLPVFACTVFLLLGGYWLYFTPTSEISIDINPSVEIGINRFDQVVSVKGYNDDGAKLADLLDVKYKNYSEAVYQILENDTIATLLSNDEIMTIGVIGTDETKSSEILSDIESLTEGKKNTYCYCVHSEEVSEAHKMGLSYGKYNAFLDVQALDPTITVDEIKTMTMKEIRDLIARLSGNKESKTDKSGNNKGYGHQGTGTGKKNRNHHGN